MICYICNEDNWNKLPELNKERTLQICKGCGNVCYEVEPRDEESVKQYYRTEYRPAPNHMNLITTTHKQNYVNLFLRDYLKDKKGLVIGDIGCATGYLVNHFRSMGHKATGCEYTLTYRRFAENFYNIPITEDLRKDLQYDLLVMYHVLEHVTEPDKKLTEYLKLLKDDGVMLVSTPEWYGDLQEASGPVVSSFEHLWHKDHINVFSQNSLKNLFIKVGLDIVKEDHFVYGQTYLLKKAQNAPHGTIRKEDWQAVTKKTHEGKKAIDLLLEGKFYEATQVWPRFPDAWLGLIYNTYGKQPDRQEDTFKKCLEVMPENKRIISGLANWHYQCQRYKQALEIFEKFITICPDEDKLMYAGFCCSFLGESKRAMAYFYQAAEMCPPKWVEAMDWMCREASNMPTWDERALNDIGEKIRETARKGLKLVDPMFDKAPEHKTEVKIPEIVAATAANPVSSTLNGELNETKYDQIEA